MVDHHRIVITVILNTVPVPGHLVSQVTAGGLPSLDVFSQLIHVLGDQPSVFKAIGELCYLYGLD